jgi:cytochrome c
LTGRRPLTVRPFKLQNAIEIGRTRSPGPSGIDAATIRTREVLMKSKIAIAGAIAAAGLLAAGVSQASQELAEKAGCNKCHAVDTKKMGSSYKDIAKRHKDNPKAEADLVAKLKSGAGHPKATASDAELVAITKWILAM